MKKIIPLVLFVLIVGFVAFFFLNNGMAMTTLISQDAGIIAKTYNKGIKGVTKHDRFYYETTTKSYASGKTKTDKTVKVSIITKSDSVSKIYATVATKEYDLEVYFTTLESGTIAYVDKTPAGENPTHERHVYQDITADQVLDEIVEAKPVMFALNGVAEKTTLQLLTEYTEQSKAQFKDKVKSKFSFSPLGAKYEYKVSDTQSYLAAIDVLGKLHTISYKEGTAKEYTMTETAFKKYDNKVSIYWKNEENFREVTPETYGTPGV